MFIMISRRRATPAMLAALLSRYNNTRQADPPPIAARHAHSVEAKPCPHPLPDVVFPYHQRASILGRFGTNRAAHKYQPSVFADSTHLVGLRGEFDSRWYDAQRIYPGIRASATSMSLTPAFAPVTALCPISYVR